MNQPLGQGEEKEHEEHRESVAKLIVQFYLDHPHRFHRVVRPVKNPKAGEFTNLNFTSRRIEDNRLSRGKRSTFQTLQPSHQAAPVGNAHGKQKTQRFKIKREAVIHSKAQFFQLVVQCLDLLEINGVARLHSV